MLQHRATLHRLIDKLVHIDLPSLYYSRNTLLKGLADSDGEQQPLATPAEKYFHSLLKEGNFQETMLTSLKCQRGEEGH